MKDHEIRELVNQLRDVAIKYHGAGQLREQIARVVRGTMLQAGNSPVIPDGLIGAVNRLLDSDGSRGCYSAIRCGDAHDEIERLLAAAPQDTPALNSVQSVVTVPGKWIPVSERMPDVGVKVLCFPVKDEPIHATFNGQLWLQDVSWSGSDDTIDNVIPVSVTHWMPLPAAPQEVKGE